MPLKNFIYTFFSKKKSEIENNSSSNLTKFNFDKTEDNELLYKYKRGIELFIDWKNFTKKLNFNDHIHIIIQCAEHLDWNILSCVTINLEEENDDFLDKCMFLFRNYINWYYFCMYNDIEENLIEKYIKYVDLNQICKYQHLSKKFCKIYKNLLNYHLVLNFQESLWDTNGDIFF